MYSISSCLKCCKHREHNNNMRVTTPRNSGSWCAVGGGWVEITLYTNHDRQGVVVSIYQHFKNETQGEKTLTNDRLPKVSLKPAPRHLLYIFLCASVHVRLCTYTISFVCVRVYVGVVKGLPLISQNVKRYWKQPSHHRFHRVNISLTPERNFPNNSERYLQYT